MDEMGEREREKQKEPFRNLLYLVTNVGSTKERKKGAKKAF